MQMAFARHYSHNADWINLKGSVMYLLLRLRGGGPPLPKKMGIAAGGMIKQDIRRDTYDPKKWMRGLTLTIPVQILNNRTFREVTGLEPPACPINAAAVRFFPILLTILCFKSAAEVCQRSLFRSAGLRISGGCHQTLAPLFTFDKF